eukprot:COSAG06_NODE_14822_length_1123_cov_1.246094_1_plen_40_part_10
MLAACTEHSREYLSTWVRANVCLSLSVFESDYRYIIWSGP